MSKHEVRIEGFLHTDPTMNDSGCIEFLIAGGVWFRAFAKGKVGRICKAFLEKGQEALLTGTLRCYSGSYHIDVSSVGFVHGGKWVYESEDEAEEGIPF